MSSIRAAKLKPSVIDTFNDGDAVEAHPANAETHVNLVNLTTSYDAVESPAANLQQRLQQELAGAPKPELKKYPPAVTVAGVVLFCSAFWYAVYALVF